MLQIFLIIFYLGCTSSNQMLSMLLLLVGVYMTASLWFISHGIIYTGLLYILVYVGAIVVLIMFVVQLTNTSLSGDKPTGNSYLTQLENGTLIVSVSLLLIMSFSYLDLNFILNFSSLFNINLSSAEVSIGDSINLTDKSANSTNRLENLVYLQKGLNGNNLSLLANSIFNEFSLILIISVHAIILAIIGPIKLALSTSLSSD